MPTPKRGERDPLLTVPEVAERLRVAEETVRRWLRSGRMTGILFSDRSGYRVLDSEVERFIAANVRTGKKPGPKPKDVGGQLRVAEERPRYRVGGDPPPEQAQAPQGKAVAA
jgi:excisionase family DNA binding protein